MSCVIYGLWVIINQFCGFGKLAVTSDKKIAWKEKEKKLISDQILMGPIENIWRTLVWGNNLTLLWKKKNSVVQLRYNLARAHRKKKKWMKSMASAQKLAKSWSNKPELGSAAFPSGSLSLTDLTRCKMQLKTSRSCKPLDYRHIHKLSQNGLKGHDILQRDNKSCTCMKRDPIK